ncbi:MAG TPA: hypothetical protein VGZ25_00930, partial [Gemmataceae bacterium]|nr:hypothetical protein [Gemmataceae bacterium]
MNGIYAGGLAVALGCWALGGIHSNQAETPSAPQEQVKSPSKAKSSGRSLAVSLGRPIAASLEKPKPLAQSLVSKAPQARTALWFTLPSAKKLTVRAQSLDDPPPVPRTTIAKSSGRVGKRADLAAFTLDNESWESEEISLCFETTHLKPIKSKVKLPSLETSKTELTTISEVPAATKEQANKIESARLTPDESPRESFAEERAAVTNAKYEVITRSPEGPVEFAAERVVPLAGMAEKPSLAKVQKGFAVDRINPNESVVVHAFHHEQEPDGDADEKDEPLETARPTKDKGSKSAPETANLESVDKPSVNPPGPLDQTQINLEGPRLIPSAAQVEFVDQNRFYGEADYLVWYTKGDRIP